MKNKEVEVFEAPIVNDEISDLTRAIIAKSQTLNIPALAAFFELDQRVIEEALNTK